MRWTMASTSARRSGRWDRLVPVGGAVLGAASCVPMIAVLPGAAATVLGAVGVSATTGPWGALSRVLGPVAQPLLILSLLLMLAGALRCGWGPAAAVALGGGLLYSSMYLLAGPMTSSMAAMGATGQTGTNAPLFYTGLGLVVASFAWSRVRRHRRACRPAWALRRSTA